LIHDNDVQAWKLDLQHLAETYNLSTDAIDNMVQP
jgi:hypothetical protein